MWLRTLSTLLDLFLSRLLTFWHLVLSLNIVLSLVFSTSLYLISVPSLSLLIHLLSRTVLRTEPCGRPLQTAPRPQSIHHSYFERGMAIQPLVSQPIQPVIFHSCPSKGSQPALWNFGVCNLIRKPRALARNTNE